MRPCISVSGLWEALWEEASATSHVSEPCEMQMAMVLYGPRRLGRPARDGIGVAHCVERPHALPAPGAMVGQARG